MAIFVSEVSSFLHSTTFVFIETKVHLNRDFDTYDVIMTSRYVEQNSFDVRETNLKLISEFRRYLLPPLISTAKCCEMTFGRSLMERRCISNRRQRRRVTFLQELAIILIFGTQWTELYVQTLIRKGNSCTFC